MENEALEFAKSLQQLYLEQRDIDGVLDSIDEHTSWIGTGEHEICKSFTEAAAALFSEKAECVGGFTVTNSWYETASLPPDACIVYGEFWAEATNPSSDVAPLHHRISAVCAKKDGEMKLLHLHMSCPDDCQSDGEYFVKGMARADNQSLRLVVEQATKDLNARNRELEVLTENLPGGVHQCRNDADFSLISMSGGFLSLFGYTRAEIAKAFNNNFLDMIFEPDKAGVLAQRDEQLAHGDTLEFEYRVLCKDGRLIWIMDRGRLVRSPDGTESFFCMLLDITRRKEADEDLRLLLERHRVILDQTTDIIFEWDIKRDTIDFSSNWEKKFGYTPITENISALIPKSDNIHPDDMPAFVAIMRGTAEGAPYLESEFRIRYFSGEYTWCRIRATTQFDNNKRPLKVVGVIVDIDSEKNRSRVLIEAAQRDALTKLYNKNTTKAKVESLMDSKNKSAIHALMIIDVDNFKTVNDRFGHQCGDAVLANMAQSLKKLFRGADVIGRIGGDEFLVFMSNIGSSKLAAAKAAEIVKIFDKFPLEISSPLSCSVGVAIFPQHGLDYAGLSRCADIALYHVKNSGKVNYAFYQDSMIAEAPHASMRTAINENVTGNALLNEELVQHVFSMLYAAVDIKTAVNQILETVGRAYDVSRVYVFETSEDGLYCSNTFEWCNVGVSPEIDTLQDLAFDTDLKGFFDGFDENGVFYCQDILSLPKNLTDILERQGIASVLQCFIKDDGSPKGYVGFDECSNNRYWTKEQIHTLTLIANVLSTFLLKERLKEQLSKRDKYIGAR